MPLFTSSSSNLYFSQVEQFCLFTFLLCLDTVATCYIWETYRSNQVKLLAPQQVKRKAPNSTSVFAPGSSTISPLPSERKPTKIPK